MQSLKSLALSKASLVRFKVLRALLLLGMRLTLRAQSKLLLPRQAQLQQALTRALRVHAAAFDDPRSAAIVACHTARGACARGCACRNKHALRAYADWCALRRPSLHCAITCFVARSYGRRFKSASRLRRSYCCLLLHGATHTPCLR